MRVPPSGAGLGASRIHPVNHPFGPVPRWVVSIENSGTCYALGGPWGPGSLRGVSWAGFASLVLALGIGGAFGRDWSQ